MKKTLKLVSIFIAIVFVGVVGSLVVYMLIQNNQTYYIYDLRIVEPIENASGYVYTDSEATYTVMKNQSVYMTSSENNRIEIGIYAYTSNDTTNVEIESSDTSVARVIYLSGKCYIEYLNAGVVTITVSIGSVSDSFVIYVYNNVADSFYVYDTAYYGNYASYFGNQIIAYSDQIDYSYGYVAASSADTSEGSQINDSLFKVDESSVDWSIFESVYIDSANQALVVRCSSDIESNIDTSVVIQSFFYTNSGDVKICENYLVKVHVIAYVPEFLQIVVATTPDFEDGYVFTDTVKIDESELTDETISSSSVILENYLSYLKTENYLENLNEASVSGVYFTEKVSKIYIKFRMVYTNGDIVYLNADTSDLFSLSSSLSSGNMNVSSPSDGILSISANGTYYVLETSSFDSNFSYNIQVSLLGYDLSYTFEFLSKSLTKENLELFYSFDKETGVYTYTYWDPRTYFDNEIYDLEGNIVDIYFEESGQV